MVAAMTLTLRTGAAAQNPRCGRADRFVRQRRRLLAAHQFSRPEKIPEHLEQALRGCFGIDPLELPAQSSDSRAKKQRRMAREPSAAVTNAERTFYFMMRDRL